MAGEGNIQLRKKKPAAYKPEDAAEYWCQLSRVSPRKMKCRPEWLSLEMACLLWVIMNTDSYPSQPLLTSLPGLCHSHPLSPLYFTRLESQCALQSSPKNTICFNFSVTNTSNRPGNVELKCKNNAKWKFLLFEEKPHRSYTGKCCSKEVFSGHWRTQCAGPTEACQDSLADARQWKVFKLLFKNWVITNWTISVLCLFFFFCSFTSLVFWISVSSDVDWHC